MARAEFDFDAEGSNELSFKAGAMMNLAPKGKLQVVEHDDIIVGSYCYNSCRILFACIATILKELKSRSGCWCHVGMMQLCQVKQIAYTAEI